MCYRELFYHHKMHTKIPASSMHALIDANSNFEAAGRIDNSRSRVTCRKGRKSPPCEDSISAVNTTSVSLLLLNPPTPYTCWSLCYLLLYSPTYQYLDHRVLISFSEALLEIQLKKRKCSPPTASFTSRFEEKYALLHPCFPEFP